MRPIIFNAFQSLSSAHESSMSPFLILEDIWIHVCIMNDSNIAPNVETPINKTFSLITTLNILYV